MKKHALAKIIILALIGYILMPGLIWVKEKPNVAIMMVDNLGWGEIGTYGGGIL